MSSTTKKTTTSYASSTAAQPKIEKKIIEEKIAKVREVVKNISTNDIVLALHNFDLDVARTIHAFCEGGSESALGDWEKTGGAKKRNNKKKAKPMSSNNGHPTTNLTKGTFGASSVSSISSATYSNGFSSNINGNHQQQYHQPVQQPNLLNGNHNQITPTMPMEDQTIIAFSTANNKQQTNDVLPPTNETTFAMVNGGGENPLLNMPTNAVGAVGNNQIESKDSFTNSISITPVDNQFHLEHNKSLFDSEIGYAQDNIQRCFKELREAINLREQQMVAELLECGRAGSAYFTARNDCLQKLNEKSNQKTFATELEKFNSAKTEDLEVALTTRFICDKADFDALVSSIGQFGSVIPVKSVASQMPAKKEVTNPSLGQQQIRRSNSPSSLVSSLDSGIGGQISPVNQEKSAVAQIDESGIVLKSDCISADMLAEIQRNILDSLKAKGIDPAVLADINSSTIMTAPRRRQPQPPKGGEQQQQKAGNGNDGGQNHQQHRSRANATGNKGGGMGKKQPQQQGNKPNAK